MSKTTNGKPSIFFSPTVKSPLGSALFAKLEEPDVFRGGDPTWKITVVFDPSDAEYKALVETIAKFAADFAAESGKQVDASSVWRTDKNTNAPCLTFKSRAKQGDDGKFIKLAVVDAAKQPTGEPWNGDKVRVAFKLGGWTSPFGAGIKPYLSAVQVIERRPKNSGGFNAVNVFDDPAEDTEIPF